MRVVLLGTATSQQGQKLEAGKDVHSLRIVFFSTSTQLDTNSGSNPCAAINNKTLFKELDVNANFCQSTLASVST